VRHQFTVEQVVSIARALDTAGVAMVEVSHGDGLGGSSLQYGLSLTDELELIRAARSALSRAKLTVLLLPGSVLAMTSGLPAILGRKWSGSRRIAPRLTSPSSTSDSRGSWEWKSQGS
jgi:4-hydroxy 2-oxovalerate aldolase